jgi:Acetyltransferase (GNAT) domain
MTRGSFASGLPWARGRPRRPSAAESSRRDPAGRAAALPVDVVPDPTRKRLEEWDELVRSYPLSDVAQLSGWARIRALVGIRALYLLMEEDDGLVGGAQVLLRHVPGLGDIGYVPYGPVISPSAAEPQRVHEALADELADLSLRRLRMLFVQPPEGGESSTEALRRRGFRPSQANIAPAASLRVDLEVDEAELRRNLGRHFRKLLNKLDSRGVRVRLGGADDLPLIAELLADTAEHQGFPAFGLDYLAKMYEELAPDGNLVAFVGEAGGRPVAMEIFTGCGGVLKLRLVGLDRDSEAAQLDVPVAIRWTAMRWAKSNGYRWFDFGGIRENTLRALTSGGPVHLQSLDGPDQHKVRFGGKPYRYPDPVELIPSPVVRAGYDFMQGSRAGRAVLAFAQGAVRTGRTGIKRASHAAASSDGVAGEGACPGSSICVAHGERRSHAIALNC